MRSPSFRAKAPVFTLLLLAGCVSAPPRDEKAVILPERIAAHVDELASDAYEGREPGTAGETKTVAYIETAFRNAGLQPLVGHSYQLAVPLLVSASESGYIAVGDMRIDNGEASFVRAPVTSEVASADAAAVFAGYGISAAVYGRDDFAGADLRGKIAFVFAGLPTGSDDAPEPFRSQSARSAKVANAVRAGATAVVVIYDAAPDDEMWRAVRGHIARAERRLDGAAPQPGDALVAVMNRDAGSRLAAALGQDLAAMKREADAPTFRPRELGKVRIAAQNRLRRFSSPNVAGVIRGSVRPDEYIVYLAHWDHFGRACAPSGDTICNGAIDNASGIGGLIELGRGFSEGRRPQRSVVFLATTAEEGGLLGGKHFAAAGPIPANRMVAAFGLDTIAANGPTEAVIVLGQGLSNLDAWVADAARARGRKVTEMPAVQSFYARSDHFAFAEAGVPAVIATGVFATGGTFENYMRDHYHKPSDAPSASIDFRGAAEDVALILDAGRALANSRDWPTWAKTSRYQRALPSQP